MLSFMVDVMFLSDASMETSQSAESHSKIIMDTGERQSCHGRRTDLLSGQE